MRNDDSELCLAHEAWDRISWKPLEIETWFQGTTNRKWPMASRMSRDPNVKVVTPICLVPGISKTAGDTDNGAPIGNGCMGIKWSRDR